MGQHGLGQEGRVASLLGHVAFAVCQTATRGRPPPLTPLVGWLQPSGLWPFPTTSVPGSGYVACTNLVPRC